MAISKEKKAELLKGYVQSLKDSDNVVVIKQDAIPVDESSTMRKELFATDGEFQVIKKRIFLKALKDAGYGDISIDDLDGSVGVLYNKTEDGEALKVVNKYLKLFKKDKESKSAFEFLGGWYDKSWVDAEYVSELANMPSKEELLSKLAWLFNYPLQSFAGVLNQIAEKGDSAEEKVEEVKEEVKEVKEEKAEEAKEEKVEEVKEEKTE